MSSRLSDRNLGMKVLVSVAAILLCLQEGKIEKEWQVVVRYCCMNILDYICIHESQCR